ncbi:protein of unknown function (DUF1802) [Nostoc sp. PCC 7524]|uniref:DUF1802 family protein n=1 Tax=Nostoc sp. (strain ATCC 29411 / PCC 7524) TaxID=28072 RepID=UPI00029ED3D9|nr:DUF1802 family protein [Nostoc sp. PCC 7524]AFY50033.1 protein of unknown function (DUF1802) [Nostoc sp. PCC 7524]
MNQLFSLPTALCLPAPEIEALIQGRTIAAMPKMFMRPGQRFSLYPAEYSNNILSIGQYYHANLLSITQKNIKLNSSQTVSIKAWAKCELCQIIDKTKPLKLLSELTIWTSEAFESIIQKQENIFLAYLRVYHLSHVCEVAVNPNIQEKLGRFVSLPNFKGSEDNPILNDRIFAQRRKQLENLEPPPHPELEELQSILAPLAITKPAVKELDDDIQIFLGWKNTKQIQSINTDLAWINEIASLGNRSKEEDAGKNNYQAGTDFEIIVRRSLEFLGFTVDYFHKGGAGGVDVFCSQPYPLVAECKAGKKIPNDTAVQLLNLGTLRLKSQELFKQATKLIIGPGEATIQLNDAAKIQDMAIMNPETLEKLVKLQSNHRNSVDLFRLKEYLKAGQSDQEVERYIDQVYLDLSMRSHIIQLVKNYLQNSGIEFSGVEALHGAYFGSNPPQPLKTEEMHEILIELSSPLTGYLGRIKGSDWRSDRFYYLRDLLIN